MVRRLHRSASVQGDTLVFMDMETYEEVRVPRDDEWSRFVKEGTDCAVLFYNGEVISVEPPLNMVLKVVQSDPGVKGNTAQGATKPATLETGAVIQVRATHYCTSGPALRARVHLVWLDFSSRKDISCVECVASTMRQTHFGLVALGRDSWSSRENCLTQHLVYKVL
jgi:hypothetical protein